MANTDRYFKKKIKSDGLLLLFLFGIFGETKTVLDVWHNPTMLQFLSFIEYKKYINNIVEDETKKMEAEFRLRNKLMGCGGIK